MRSRKMKSIFLPVKTGMGFTQEKYFINSIYNLDESAVRQCLENGMNIDLVDYSGRTPLIYAVQNRDIKTALFLLKLGANVNAKDQFEGTPLMIAVLLNSLELIYSLIYAGADVNLSSRNGMTPLMITRKSEVVQKLIRMGANWNLRDNDNMTALMHYCSSGRLSLVNTLLDYFPELDHRNTNGLTALQIAEAANRQKIFRLLRKWQAPYIA